MFENRRKVAQANRARLIERLSDYYQTVDYGKLELPHFIKATNIIDDFRRCGILTPMYELKQKKGA